MGATLYNLWMFLAPTFLLKIRDGGQGCHKVFLEKIIREPKTW